MKIGIDATVVFSDRPTGLGVYTINMVNELYRLHQDVVVWTIANAGFDLPQSCLRQVMKPVRFLGNRLYPVRPLWLESRLGPELRKEGVDVLWSPVPSALSRSPVPHLVTVHDLIPLRFPEDVPPWVRWNFAKRVLSTIGNASGIIADSVATQEDLQQLKIRLPSIDVVYPAFDSSHFRQVDPLPVLKKHRLDQIPYLLYIGNSSPRKNLDCVIRAFKAVSVNLPHILVLGGAKAAKEQEGLERTIRQLGLQERVMLLNYLPFADLPSLYSGAASLVYLSLYEGFGLPVLEAMACGTPVIASNCTSIPEVAGDAALLVDPNDIDAVTTAISSVLTNQDLRCRMIKAGFSQSQKFSWSSSAHQLLHALHKLTEVCHA